MIWRAKYEPFGKATVDPAPDACQSLFELNVRFPGQYADAETGWHYNFYRTYDPNTGRYLEPDPLGQLDGTNVFPYAHSNAVNVIDPSGLLSAWEVGLGVGNFATGLADAASFGLGPLARSYLDEKYGWGGYYDPCSPAYRAGGWASLATGLGRLGYAAAAKAISQTASSGLAASAARSSLKIRFRLGTFSNYKRYDPTALLGKYGSDQALREAAGRTNPLWNAIGANFAFGSAVNLNCTCDSASTGTPGGAGPVDELAGQFLGGFGALNRR